MDMSAGSSSLNMNGKRPLEPSNSNISNDSFLETDASASGVAALPRTDKNGEPLSEKKLRRLEKNRLSARECRRRKKEATENLQREINIMEGENLRLRLQLQVRDAGTEPVFCKWKEFSGTFGRCCQVLNPTCIFLTLRYHCR